MRVLVVEDEPAISAAIKVIAFAEALAHAHVHVGRPTQRGRVLLGLNLQPLLVGAHRFPGRWRN